MKKQKKIVCPACGKETTIGWDSCFKCGADIRGAVPAGVTVIENVKNFFVSLIRFAIILAILAMFGLAFWPAEDNGRIGNAEEAARIQSMIEKMPAVVDADRPFKTHISETEMNAWFDQLIEDSPKSGGSAFQVPPRFIHADIHSDSMDLVVGSSLLGAPLTYKINFLPTIHGGKLDIDLNRTDLGHLPMPWKLKDVMAQKVYDVFGNLGNAESAVNGLSGISLGEEGKITIYRKAAGTPSPSPLRTP